MTRSELTEKILDIKLEKNWTWKHIVAEIGGMSEVLVVGALLGQMKFRWVTRTPPRRLHRFATTARKGHCLDESLLYPC